MRSDRLFVVRQSRINSESSDQRSCPIGLVFKSEVTTEYDKWMKTILMISTLVLTVFLNDAVAGLLFTYHQLAVKDLDQMNGLVAQKLTESKKSTDGKHVPLKEVLQAIYSRPNEDGMIDKVVAQVRSGLEEQEMYEKVIQQLTDEAINALKNPKNFKPDVQVTYAVFLENIMSELKPRLKEDGFERRLMLKIQNSEIEITKQAKNERIVRMMKNPISPSETAKLILEFADAQKAEAAKKDASAKKEEGQKN